MAHGNWENIITSSKNRYFNDLFVSNGSFYTGGYQNANNILKVLLFRGSIGGSPVDISNSGINIDFQSILGIWGVNSDVFFLGSANVSGVSKAAIAMAGFIPYYYFPGTLSGFKDAWGLSKNNLFIGGASGSSGKIVHFDQSKPTDGKFVDGHLEANANINGLSGITGAEKIDIYAVGGKGTILHYGDLPEIPALITPRNELAIPQNTATFSWNTAESATNYFIQIASDSNFSVIVEEKKTQNQTTITNSNLFHNDGTQYFWRVKAINSAGESDYSETRTFFNMAIQTTDFDSDGDTDSMDLVTLMNEYGRTDCAINSCMADLDSDGDVDNRDIELFNGNFGY